MEYINYVKQSPVQGMTGLWGGTQGSLTTGAGAVKFVTGGDRGMWGGGNPDEMSGPGSKADDGGFKVIDYVNITSTGNASDFGRLTIKNFAAAACSNQTRGVWMAGGSSPVTIVDVMQYVTIASTGNATDFGNAAQAIYSGAGCSDGSEGNRGLYWAGYAQGSGGTLGNQIAYITITSTGNATDFGDTLTNTGSGQAWADLTRGCFNGSDPSHNGTNVIQYVTIQSTGNATDFGDMVGSMRYRGAAADATRGVISNGEGQSTAIEYVTIATLGNASNFGSSTISTNGRGGCNNETRSCFAGGEDTRGAGGNPNQVGYDVIDYVTTQTTGNATDFGNLIIGRRQQPGGLAGNPS